MLTDEEKAEFRSLLVEVATTEMRTMVVDAVGSAFAESQRLTGEKLVLLGKVIDDVVDRLDVIENDLRSTRYGVARLGRVKERLEEVVGNLERRVSDLENG